MRRWLSQTIRYFRISRETLGHGRLSSIAFAVSGGANPRFQGGGPEPTFTTSAAVTAYRLVEVSGNRTIAPAGAASRKVVGVAKQTGSAVGDKVSVATSGVWKLRAQGAIAAGDEVGPGAGADGRVSTVAAGATADVTRTIVGLALEAISDGADGLILLRKLT